MPTPPACSAGTRARCSCPRAAWRRRPIPPAPRRLLEVIAFASGWLLVAMAAVTCFDVLARKTGLPVPLTKLPELEWHFHAAIFSLG